MRIEGEQLETPSRIEALLVRLLWHIEDAKMAGDWNKALMGIESLETYAIAFGDGKEAILKVEALKDYIRRKVRKYEIDADLTHEQKARAEQALADFEVWYDWNVRRVVALASLAPLLRADLGHETVSLTFFVNRIAATFGKIFAAHGVHLVLDPKEIKAYFNNRNKGVSE